MQGAWWGWEVRNQWQCQLGWQEASAAGGDEVLLVAVRDCTDWGVEIWYGSGLSWGTVAVLALGYQW